ncbi:MULTISPECIES: hypothetical protein [unclassified Caballeronia]|uniref:hypothetical protein n=1 Tax=unclassified Caballeronia TaxID=2646786 RepID=UPI002854FDBD|nr:MULTISPECIES: hypothetical protein [unclassified Caballeronia]MDR5753037.1 hypothetical protein [Caballeronia sp. LZ024]MDR5845065.1 hypothetical protein [Caballeronia sp. LZ031]
MGAANLALPTEPRICARFLSYFFSHFPVRRFLLVRSAVAGERISQPTTQVLALALAAEGGMSRLSSPQSGDVLQPAVSNYYDLALFDLNRSATVGTGPNITSHDKVLVAATSDAAALTVFQAHARGHACCYELHWGGQLYPVYFLHTSSGLYL